MPPHPSQPGLEVNDSPGLEVVVPTYESEESKYRAAYQGLGNQGVDYSPNNYQNYQGAPSYPNQIYQGGANYQRPYFPGSSTEQAIYQGSDKEAVPNQSHKQQKKILGLPVLWFWIIISLIVVGAIAGGVGGSVAAKNSRSSVEQSSTLTSSSLPSPATTSPPTRENPSPTTQSPTTSSPKGTINPSIPNDGGCPSINGTTFIPRSSAGQQIGIANRLPSQSFTRLCNTNYPSGAEYGNPGLSDISKVWAPTLDDCMRLCAEYNAMFNVSGATFNYSKGFCRSVAIVEKENEFCYLKNGTGLNNTMGPPELVASAVLIQDPTVLE